MAAATRSDSGRAAGTDVALALLVSATTSDLEPVSEPAVADLVPPADARATTRRPPVWARVVAVVASIIVSLVMAEVVAGIIRHHAFPFLNLYMEDATYGVRLEPDASTHLSSRTGHVTEIRTNALGFRGDDWTSAATANHAVPGRVLLLGDSQVMGYGVEVEEGLAARLQSALGPGHEVLNAATPTWGPREYADILAELAPEYRPEFVIFVANVANDWFETRLPNRQRTTARDGWARVKLPSDEPASDFPGRRFLLGKSHLVYAVRALFASGASARAGAGASPLAASATRLVRDLPWLIAPEGPFRSRVAPFVRQARDTCARLGCEVIVVTLPLDVQVDAREWHKYDERPVDLDVTKSLATALLHDARDAHLVTLDLLPVLRAASPGAFQADDYHLSPAGHDAFARALAPLLLVRAQAHTLEDHR